MSLFVAEYNVPHYVAYVNTFCAFFLLLPVTYRVKIKQS
nr:MAG TPA: hypothetical protein [Caudoviricetes sp.]